MNILSVENWLAFALAASIILIIPGPTIILVISQAVAHGRRSAFPLATGVLLGDFTAMTLSLAGLGALLSVSAELFITLKWIGALYLIYLGGRLFSSRRKSGSLPSDSSRCSSGALLKSAFIVTALNPKSIAFFVAFLPQFVSPDKPVLLQLVFLGTTFLVLAFFNALLYALFAGYLRSALQRKKIRKWLDYCGGSALIGAGIFTAALQRST